MVNSMKLKRLYNKVIDIIHNNRWVFLTFVASFITMMIIFILQKIAPFGENSMLDVDFFHQYGPFLNELRDRVVQGENLLYSFNTGGGIPFYRNFLNYLSSPFNIILFFFKKENIVMSYSIIIAFKIIFASTFMSYYLKKVFKNDNIFNLIFGLFYAYSGYFCAFYWNIMWLDGIVFLPLIMYGINKIINENKIHTYIIFLTIMLIANYFIGYMICIFSVLYFIGCMFIKGNYNFKFIIKKITLFLISSLLSGGISAIFLLPLFTSLKSISATGGMMPLLEFNFKISDFLFNHITGVERTVFASDILPLPNVYCGLITLVLILLLFINKKVNIKIKICSFVTLVFFFICFNLSWLDFAWHAFHVPNDLPWRYSFLYVFCLTTIAYYSAIKLKYVSKLKVSICFSIIMIFIMLSAKLNFKNIIDEKVLLCSIMLLIYYLIYLFSFISGGAKKASYILVIILASFEMIYGINSNWHINHNISNFMRDKKDYKKLISKVRKYDNDLYRIEKTDYVTLNDGAWYDYYGMSTFSSMAYESVSDFQRKMGLGGNTINSYYYRYYQTPVYNTIFNIKYLLGDSINNDYYEVIDSNKSANLISYKYPSSIAYAANNKLKKWKLLDNMPFYNQKNFVYNISNYNNIYKDVLVKDVVGATITNNEFINNSNGYFNYTLDDKTKNEFSLILNNESKDNIYIYVGGNDAKGFYVNDRYYSITSDEYYIVDIGKFSDDEVEIKVNVSGSLNGSINFYAYNLDKEVFNNFYNYINNGKLNIKEYNELYINGDISINKDEFVFTTIAYDEGWRVFVDKKEVNTFKVADSYLAFNAKKGKHNIELRYYPKNMKLGMVISIISFVIAILFVLKLKNTKKGKFIV